MKNRTHVIGLVLFLLLANAASGQITFDGPHFRAEVLTSGISQPRDISFAPGGVFGNDLFVVSNENASGESNTGSILTFDDSGAETVWVSGLNGPYGIAFADGGTFGTAIYVNCEDTLDGIRRVDPITLSVSSCLTYVDEGTGVVLADGGKFGDYLYAVQSVGAGRPNSAYRIGGDFQDSILTTLGPGAHMNDLLLSDGGAFGEYLYTVATLDPEADGTAEGYLVRIDSDGSYLILIEGIPYARTFLAQSPGGLWPEVMYLASEDTIYTVSPDWQVSTFATGFSGLAGIEFAPDGSALYVAQSGGGTIYRIAEVPEPATISLLALGGVALLRRKK